MVWWPAPRCMIAPALVCEHLRGNMREPLQACRDGRWLKRLFLVTSHYKPARVSTAKGQEICWVKACRAVQCRHGILLGIFPCIPIFQDQQIIPYVYIDMYSPILNCYCLPKSSNLDTTGKTRIQLLSQKPGIAKVLGGIYLSLDSLELVPSQRFSPV